MSTNDVPGADPRNGDALALGCWAEHADGSLILVESTESDRVIYSVFDMGHEPPMEYRDAMPEVSFKSTYSWDPVSKKATNEKWTWHDKTPSPWDRIIKGGLKDGPRYAAAEHVTTAAERIAATRGRHTTAAERVAAELRLRGEELDRSNIDHRMDRVLRAAEGMFDCLAAAVSRLPGTDSNKRRGARR